jgi:hypothetical protein
MLEQINYESPMDRLSEFKLELGWLAKERALSRPTACTQS